MKNYKENRSRPRGHKILKYEFCICKKSSNQNTVFIGYDVLIECFLVGVQISYYKLNELRPDTFFNNN